jgi:hypothetical protein
MATARKPSRSKRRRQQESDVDDDPRTEADEEYEDEVDEEPEAEADEELEDEVDEEPEDEEPEDEEPEDEEPEAEEDEEPEAEEDEEPEDEGEVSAFEDEMHELQADLGDDWILSFTVQGDEAWLTAEKSDGSQHLEAPTADVLREAVELLEGGGEDAD